jgi:hypothetical protein
MTQWHRLFVFALMMSASAPAQIVTTGNVMIDVPTAWTVSQTAKSDSTTIIGLTKGAVSLTFYNQPMTGLPFKATFVNGSTVTSDVHSEQIGDLNWNVLETSKGVYRMKAFSLELNRQTYYGYARAKTAPESQQAVAEILGAVRILARDDRSLTGNDYTGKKYYVGFGDLLSGFMGNEVKYDVAHTNNIFTKDVGGGYVGKTLITKDQSGAPVLRQYWSQLQSTMSPQDMYVEYSSGHGSKQELMFGVSYDEIRKNALALPAKEIIVFIMSCYSGNLVNSFNNHKTEWQDWAAKGRSLMVMASSRANESSATGPQNDADEPNGPKGSAGSAFGYSLWKSLIGYADGYIDGVKDGFISLDEIREYTTARTKQLGGHTPVITGVYADSLIMNRVPPKRWVEEMERGEKSLTEAQLMAQIRRLDDELRVK